MKSNNVIEINGHLYDAKSGKPLDAKPKQTPQSAAQPAKTAANPVRRKSVSAQTAMRQRRQSIDGFSPRKGAQTQLIENSVETKAATKPNLSRKATAPKMKRKVHKSSTLHRRAVTAPALRVTKDSPSTDKKKPAQKTVAKAALSSTALRHADSQRLKRAQEVSKSTAISRFNLNSPPKKAPAKETTTPAKPLAYHLKTTHSNNTIDNVPQSTKEHLIQNAVAKAPIKPAAANKKPKQNHIFSRYATSALVVLLLAGYIAYLNIPSISMKVAAHRAGFAANLPSYKPSGYSFKGPIAYTPGQVTVNFKSNTDDRAFSLKQQPTTWDSTALLENVVTKKSPTYLTYQDKGLTIYIFNGSSAAWVNGGKLYTIEGDNSQLDTDQLLKLATSV